MPPCTITDYMNGNIDTSKIKLDQSPIYFTNKKLYKVGQQVKVRLISPYKLPHKSKDGKWVYDKDITNILIHIHGGGFVATSSKIHQTYTRKWAKKANIIIFSIDYRLAPEYTYPASLTDVFNAYYWIVTHAYDQLGIQPKKILLAGDSAGGNLALALALRVIRSDLMKPIGILCGYPAMNLSMKGFTPSLVLSLYDSILRHSMLMAVLQCYVGDGNPNEDPYLSPAVMSDADICSLPRLRMMIAGKDPLKDECIKFSLRAAYMIKLES